MNELAVCCGCGVSVPLDDADDWMPGVFHNDTCLGDLCPPCASQVGIRAARPGEFPHNDRIINYPMFLAIRRREQSS